MLTALLCLLALSSHGATAEDHYDTRCSCKCPNAESIFGPEEISIDYPNRKVYINSAVNASDCTCQNVVTPLLGLSQEQMEKFCPRCNCQHETRSVMTIKVVVGLIIWVLSLLLIYLLYLVFVDPVFRPKRLMRANNSYQQHTNDDHMENLNDENVDLPNSTQLNNIRPRSVVNKVKNDQEKWKRQVEFQRTSVYDRHTMLN